MVTKIATGILIIISIITVHPLHATRVIEAPDLYVSWDSQIAFPIYVTISDSYRSGAFSINFCNYGDSLNFRVDSITLSGNQLYTTYWDTTNLTGFEITNTVIDPFPNSYAAFAWNMVFPTYYPPMENEIICVVWGHLKMCHPADFDTIELYLSSEPGCPPQPDTLYNFIDGNIYIVPYLYTRGDVNVSGGPPDLTDIMFLAYHLIDPSSLPCQRAADCNLDGDINVADVIALVNYIYMGGTLPEPSYPNTCGYNFQDTLPCDEFPPCGYGGD